MKKLFLGTFLFGTSLLCAQQTPNPSSSSKKDTVQLKEVVLSANVILAANLKPEIVPVLLITFHLKSLKSLITWTLTGFYEVYRG